MHKQSGKIETVAGDAAIIIPVTVPSTLQLKAELEKLHVVQVLNIW